MADILDDLKREEGFSFPVYQDHLGYWTIGYGFLVDARRGGGVPPPIAEQWLAYLVQIKREMLENRLPWYSVAHPDVQRALLNMAYQLGVEGLLKFHQTLALLEAGDREGAAASAMQSLWARQTPARAKRVTDLIRGSEAT